VLFRRRERPVVCCAASCAANGAVAAALDSFFIFCFVIFSVFALVVSVVPWRFRKFLIQLFQNAAQLLYLRVRKSRKQTSSHPKKRSPRYAEAAQTIPAGYRFCLQ
jgi:hypothetical protein